MIPPMLIQPFVENVFLHAFDKNIITPTLTINFKKNQNLLFCEIIDNGKGMDKEVFQGSKNSKGIKLATERMKLVQKEKTEPIIKSIPNVGTTITLVFQIN
jgi:sensor histidine kinase YesM